MISLSLEVHFMGSILNLSQNSTVSFTRILVQKNIEMTLIFEKSYSGAVLMIK